MGVPYKLFYRLGFHPWEDLAEHSPFADKLLELVEREESGREPPYGHASGYERPASTRVIWREAAERAACASKWRWVSFQCQ